MARNKKSKEKKINKITENLKANDPLVEKNDLGLTDPFAFAANAAMDTGKEIIKASRDLGNSVLNPKKLRKSANSSKMKNDKTPVSHNNESQNQSSNNPETVNPSNLLIDRMFTSIKSAMNKTLEQNTFLMQDAIKCKDAKDMLNLQQKVLETNFNNLMSLCLDVNFAIQAFVTKSMQVSSEKTNQHVKCFTGEII